MSSRSKRRAGDVVREARSCSVTRSVRDGSWGDERRKAANDKDGTVGRSAGSGLGGKSVSGSNDVRREGEVMSRTPIGTVRGGCSFFFVQWAASAIRSTAKSGTIDYV